MFYIAELILRCTCHLPWLAVPTTFALSRRLWDEADFKSGQFQGRMDLDRIPLVTKQQARGQISMLREKPVGGGQQGTDCGDGAAIAADAICPLCAGGPRGQGSRALSLRLSNGAYLHAYVLLDELFESDTSRVRQYQLVQDEPGIIELRIWPLRAPDPAVLGSLRSRME